MTRQVLHNSTLGKYLAARILIEKVEQLDKTVGTNAKKGKVVVAKNGPYIVSGNLPLVKEIIVIDGVEGCPGDWSVGESYPSRETYALCRCGKSKTKPYCDGSHVKAGFDGTETASKEKFIDQAEAIGGRDIVLLDVPTLCARARFCHQAGGIWELVYNQQDEQTRKKAEKIANQCPTGRLVIWDKKTEEPMEPHYDPSISLIEDPEKDVSGGIWLKGGIPVTSADGKPYETRNRMTLCRCGESKNKPFCDGSHIDCGFNDSNPSINE